MNQGTITTNAGQICVLRKWRELQGNQRRTMIDAKCVCGKIFQASLDNLRRHNTNSCGCYQSNQTSRKNYKHGHTNWDRKRKRGFHSRTYRSWASMKKRCLNKNCSMYRYAGAMGIKVCDEWLDFEVFLKDMGEKPLNHRLNRKDRSGDFEPDNCEWVPFMGKRKPYQ